MGILTNFFSSFVLGILTPLTAVCVLPLYPGFLAYLANQFSITGKKKIPIFTFGLIITAGVILFMLLLGLVFTTFLQMSLTSVIGIVSPIAFGILALISLLLIFDVDIGRFMPKVQTPLTKNPLASAFVYGFFFGAIVVPCNPAFIAALFAKSALVTNAASNILNFLSFGIGLAFPLLIFSAISTNWSQKVIGFLTRNKRAINLVAGLFMLFISLYYLVFVFRVFG